MGKENEETICFYDKNYVLSIPLTKENILDYFSLSPFYDKSCLNEILKMQSKFANVNIKSALSTTPGVSYALEDEPQDGLFIIRKQEYNGRVSAILRMYYCLHGYIFCAPSMETLYNTRMIEVLWRLNGLMDSYEDGKQVHWLRGIECKPTDQVDEGSESEKQFLVETFNEFIKK